MVQSTNQKHVASNVVVLYPREKENRILIVLHQSTKFPIFKTKLTGLGEFGVRLLSGENITIACSNKSTKPKLIHTGCHENKSEPGFAK